ncbi:putative lipid II flippase FtsW [bacterium]|nr:putative lipid II flippase FtsW [bacterium]
MNNYYRPDQRVPVSRSFSFPQHVGDYWLLGAAALLTALGLVMIYSSSTFVAAQQNKMDWFFLFRQLKHTVFALIALYMGAKMDVSVYRKWIKVLLLGTVILMLLQLTTPLGPVIGGTKRWLNLGFTKIQTSEAARCLIVIYLAKVLTDEPDILNKIDKRLLKHLAIIAVPMFLTMLQPDLSGSLMMASTAGLVLFLGGMKLVHIIGMLIACAIPASLALLRNAYQRERIFSFIQRFTEGGGGIGGDNYQTFQSLIGFGRGGLFGVGLGQGKQKMLFLPEPHTDFIFSIIGEELGLIRTVIVVALFLFLAIRAFKVVRAQNDRFKYLLGAGLTGSIIMYAMINMYVATGLLPVTGLPLPFISSGGTSLVVSLWSIGVLWNISRSTGKGVK